MNIYATIAKGYEDCKNIGLDNFILYKTWKVQLDTTN